MLITLARKPLNGGGNVVNNCLQFGPGALNVDACRIFCGTEHMRDRGYAHKTPIIDGDRSGLDLRNEFLHTNAPGGRWPANVLTTSGAAGQMDEQSGDISSQTKRTQPSGKRSWFETGVGGGNMINYADKGGASRFFKQIKDTP